MQLSTHSEQCRESVIAMNRELRPCVSHERGLRPRVDDPYTLEDGSRLRRSAPAFLLQVIAMNSRTSSTSDGFRKARI